MRRAVALPLVALPLAVLALVASGCGADPSPPAAQAPSSASMSATPSAPAVAEPSSPLASPSSVQSVQPAQPSFSISVPAELQSSAPNVEVLGADMSWPQCPPGTGIPEKQGQGSPYPIAAARYVVLGLTNGPGFTPNPCLADQLAFVKQRRLQAAAYSVVSYPSASTLASLGGTGPYDAGSRLGRLANTGYQQALFNIATMKRVGLTTPVVWLDVEPVPKFDWPTETSGNAAVVSGAARGYRDNGYPIGAYSTQALWQRVVGDLRLDIPEWRAAGQTSRDEARRRCGPERMFQGGSAVLSQWVEAGRDQNITCPGTSVRMAIWFHQY